MKSPSYSAETHGIMVSVEPVYMDDQSAPEDNHYVWAYHIEISNNGSQSVQLQRRYWRITDALGRTQEVRGEGVVGEQPVIRPGESFTYTSGAPLNTPSGMMGGIYEMDILGGGSIEVTIPTFSLDYPYENRRLN